MDDEQAKNVVEELTKIQINSMEQVMKLADKNNMERDELIDIFAATILQASELGSYKDYKFKEDK